MGCHKHKHACFVVEVVIKERDESKVCNFE